MKRKTKLISGISIFAMLLGVGISFANNSSVVHAADTVTSGTYSTMTTSEDGKTRTWDFTNFTNTVDKVDLNGIIDNEIWFYSEKSAKVRHMVTDSFLSHKEGGELYIPVPLNSTGSISFIDRNNKDDRYTELYINGVGTTRYVYCTKADTPFVFTSEDITVVNDVSYLHFKNILGEMKTNSITVKLTTQSYLGADVYATGIVDNEVASPIEIVSGESYTLNYSITTETGEATTDKSNWSTSDEEVVTVVDGVITAVGAGNATVTLEVGSVSHSWDVYVAPVTATAITLDKLEASGLVGESVELIPTLTPSNATSDITWESSDEEVATVENGIVTYVGEGVAAITATVEGTITATCNVIVSYVSTTHVELDQSTLNLGVNASATLTAIVTPSDSQDEINWSSSDEEVAIVENGVVTGLKAGEATITVTSGSQSASCVVTVSYLPAESITLSETSLTLLVNEVRKIDVTVNPEGANDVPTFVSEDEGIALVDENGYVRASGLGTTNIVVTCGSVIESVAVNVIAEGDLTFNVATDALPVGTDENYFVNGYSMYFNKTVSKSQTIDGVPYSTGAQVKTITFFAPSKGILTANFCQTGSDKDRDLQLIDKDGNVLSSTHLPATQDVYKYVVDVKETGFYTLYVKDNASVDGTEGMINLYTLAFEEVHVFAAYQYKTNGVRLVGGVDETVDLANVKTFGVEVDGTKYTTNVALTNLKVNDTYVEPSDYGYAYFFTYTVESTTNFTFRTYVELKDGTLLYSSYASYTVTF